MGWTLLVISTVQYYLEPFLYLWTLLQFANSLNTSQAISHMVSFWAPEDSHGHWNFDNLIKCSKALEQIPSKAIRVAKDETNHIWDSSCHSKWCNQDNSRLSMLKNHLQGCTCACRQWRKHAFAIMIGTITWQHCLSFRCTKLIASSLLNVQRKAREKLLSDSQLRSRDHNSISNKKFNSRERERERER